MSAGESGTERAFVWAMESQGICVPDDLRAGALAEFRQLETLRTLLRAPRPAESEPSNVFAIDPILRGR